jgi:hypothetical protein
MPEANGKENSVDMNRRNFLGRSGVALAAVGMAAHVASGAVVGQESTSAIAPIIKQTVLQSHMQKAESATLRIGKGISAGLLDEVAAGAADLAKVFQDTAEVNIRQTAARQAAWQKGSFEAADHARLLSELAAAALERGEKEISAEIVEIYASVISAAANCHRTFRTRA